MPFLLTKKDFWQGWFELAVKVAEFTPLLLAVIGFFLLRDSKVRYLIIGLAVGFVVFSVAFTYHIHTHPYYHIQLFPIIGLSLGTIVINVAKSIRQSAGKFWWMPMAATLLLVSYFGYYEIHDSLYQTRLEDPSVAQEIGEIVRHSPHTVFVSYYYGVPLEYHGEFGGAPWPVRIEDAFYRRPGERQLTVEERIKAFGFTPEYYVVTNFGLFSRKHGDLQAYLETTCSLLAQTDDYIVYNSCKY
jgi:hypothetical protein